MTAREKTNEHLIAHAGECGCGFERDGNGQILLNKDGTGRYRYCAEGAELYAAERKAPKERAVAE